jgi:hypothetical protein
MLRYCDFIADRIKKSLTASMLDIKEPVQIEGIGKVQWDLGPNGEFLSTKKVLSIMIEGVGYKVTVEETRDDNS